MSRGGGREPGRGLRAWVLVTALLTISSSPVTGDCLKHITVTGVPLVAGEAGNLTARLVLPEEEEVGRPLYQVIWDEALAPPLPARHDFVRFFQVDDSVPRQWTVTLRESLLGVPDYPGLKNEITEVVVFPAFSDGHVCSLALSHLIQDANTKTPVMEASSWFLQVAGDFPTHTPLPGLTVTVTDDDATTPNNLMEVSVERGCPLAAGRALYGGVAGQGHPALFHLTSSPMGYQVNHTITCTLTVKDLGRPSRSAVATLTLYVEEAPHEPRFAFASPFYRAQVSPGTEVGAPLITSPAPVQVRDGSLAAPPRVTYSLRDAWPGVASAAEYFTIDTLTGEVRVARALGGPEGAGAAVLPLVLTARESSGEVSTAILEVTLDHSLPILPLPFSPRVPSPRSSPLPPSPASCPCLATPTSRRRARAGLSFSKMSYAAEVFQTDTFVGRVEARLRGRRGKIHYSWAGGNEDFRFALNYTSGVITVAAASVTPGHHLLTVQATAGRLSAKTQVSVRVVAGGGAGPLGGGTSRACTPSELLGLQVAVGVLAALLGLLLLALGIAGALLYRRRKAREQTEVKHISTLGSAYPNLSFSRESQE